MNQIRLIAFDLDGTLLKDNKELTPRTLDALKKASKAGIYLVPTTGRLYDGVPEEIRTLPFIRYGQTERRFMMPGRKRPSGGRK